MKTGILAELVTLLKQRSENVSVMESCTGGAFSNEITNIDGSSDVFGLAIITYSNNFKKQFGVSNEIIDTYSVYSVQTAQEMAKIVALTAGSTWGIGTTGQIGKSDLKNEGHPTNQVYYSIYNKQNNKYYSYYIDLREKDSREVKKSQIVEQIAKKFKEILLNEK